MNLTGEAERFVSEATLQNPNRMRLLLSTAGIDSTAISDAAFYGSFASKIFTIMKREGPAAQGFERMQQSFVESVQRIRGIIESIEQESGVDLDIRSTAAMVELISDLAELKRWFLASAENTE